MLAEVISIGDELTSGQRLDTNSQWLSERLGELGIRVLYHTTVADDLAANIGVFRQAAGRVDLILATGGLGPTADDLTRDALAQAAGVPLMLDEPSLAHIRALFARRERPMPERNVVQAMLPDGSRAIPNPHGSAPGIDMTLPRADGGGCRLFSLPGVPAEMREMWSGTVEGELAKLSGGRVIRHFRLKCFGVGESDLEAMLPDLIRRGRTPSVGITVSGATITLRITAEGASADACQAAIGPTIETIHGCLGTLVFGEEDDELEHAAARLLQERGATLATAEWGTGGLIARWLTEAPQAAAHYRGGFVATSAESLARLPGVPAGVGEQPPASAEVAAALAAACRDTFHADYGLSVSAFPPFDPQATTPGTVYFGLADKRGVTVKSTPYWGHPDILKTRCAKHALNVLRLSLLAGG